MIEHNLNSSFTSEAPWKTIPSTPLSKTNPANAVKNSSSYLSLNPFIGTLSKRNKIYFRSDNSLKSPTKMNTVGVNHFYTFDHGVDNILVSQVSIIFCCYFKHVWGIKLPVCPVVKGWKIVLYQHRHVSGMSQMWHF